MFKKKLLLIQQAQDTYRTSPIFFQGGYIGTVVLGSLSLATNMYVGPPGARYFTANNYEYFNLASYPNFGTNDAWLSFFINANSLATSPDYPFFFGAAADNQAGFLVTITLTGGTYDIRSVVGNGTSRVLGSYAGDLNFGQWHHCLIHWDRDGDQNFYVDTNLIDNKDISAFNGDSILCAGKLIGRISSVNNAFDGALSRIGIGIGAPTSDEISELYNNGYGKTYSELPQSLQKQTLYWYDCNEISGNLIDSKGGNDGVDNNTVTFAVGPRGGVVGQLDLAGFLDQSIDINTGVVGRLDLKGATALDNTYALDAFGKRDVSGISTHILSILLSNIPTKYSIGTVDLSSDIDIGTFGRLNLSGSSSQTLDIHAGPLGARLFAKSNLERFERSNGWDNPGTNDFWFGYWVKHTTQSTYQVPIYAGSNNDVTSGFRILHDSAGYIRPYFGNGITRLNKITSSVLTDGVWSYVLVTYDRDGDCDIYHNGSWLDSMDISSMDGDNITIPVTVYIGSQGGVYYFDGALSRIAYGIGTLPTTDEITELYNSGNGKTFAELSSGLQQKVNNYYDCNEFSSNMLDSKDVINFSDTNTVGVATGPRTSIFGRLKLAGTQELVNPYTLTAEGHYEFGGAASLSIILQLIAAGTLESEYITSEVAEFLLNIQQNKSLNLNIHQVEDTNLRLI